MTAWAEQLGGGDRTDSCQRICEKSALRQEAVALRRVTI